jgi:hypothetical protein
MHVLKQHQDRLALREAIDQLLQRNEGPFAFALRFNGRSRMAASGRQVQQIGKQRKRFGRAVSRLRQQRSELTSLVSGRSSRAIPAASSS